ncbi:MAG: tRNA (guanine(10)-N(2))-dimethyltransferase [Candidatus Bilamarchaeaceae archaeon]
MILQEENISFEISKKVFYNPNMRFCRSIFSLGVGAINRDLVVCDAFAASGIRGIRYAKENSNVKRVIFVDLEKEAIKCIKKNVKISKIKNTKIMQGNISRLVFDIVADFAEVDPFGTPAPYLYDVFRMFNPLKEAYLSVTATDTAVLCGGKVKAAMKNYHSKPLNNEFTHENGTRILLKKITEVAAEFNFGCIPILSLSDRHYLKVLLYLKRGADAADRSLKQLGFVIFCPKCGYRSTALFPERICPLCHSSLDYAGPLWLGAIADKKFVKKMIKLNSERDYADKKEIEKTLDIIYEEAEMPPYFYDIHAIAKRTRKSFIPKMDDMLNALRREGYDTTRTHFCPTGIKTKASYKDVISIISKL